MPTRIPFLNITLGRRNRLTASLWPALLWVVAVSLFFSPSLMGAETVDFNREIRPLLSANCFACHGPDEEERAAGLRLDIEDGSREDLGGYAAIVPGDPDSSELIVRLTTDDEDLRMPPEGKGQRLNEQQIDLVRRWISQGAPYARHWAYEVPQRPQLPRVSNRDWPINPIDHFILARLEREGLQPSVEADRLTLARRVAIDLTGLPPTWEEAVSLRDDPRADAYERFVDRMLGKLSFGERWARVWLDLARYADSAGYADDPPRTIWAFRDYVIRSLNDNKPFDQFTIEQIAGDLLPEPTDEHLIATAFHRNTLTNNEGGTNDEEFRNVAIVDRVNTTMAVWMGTTMACAQCHTHKYDPITQEEYFRFFAFFNNSQDADRKDESPLLEVWSDEQKARKEQLRKEIEQISETLATSTPELEAAQERWVQTLRNEPDWRPLVPSSAVATDRELQIDDGGWVSAADPKPDQDRYTIQYPTDDATVSAVRIVVPKQQRDNFVLSGVDATWVPDDHQPVRSRYLRVELPGKGKMIHLAEVQVFSGGENIATEGQASQSSTDYGGKAQLAIDGNTDGDFEQGSVTHTAAERDPWLEIDLGSERPIERLVIWNRSDGGDRIAGRIKGFQVRLLDAERETVWSQSPSEVPGPEMALAVDQSVRLDFAAALADHEQVGFPAESVLDTKPSSDRGWAIAPQQGKPHELTLVLRQPIETGKGTLTLNLSQISKHVRHLLDRFRVEVTSDRNVSQWARIPKAIRELIRVPSDRLATEQRDRVAEYYRSITPLLSAQRNRLAELRKSLASIKPTTTVPVMRELPEEQHRTTKVQIRGNYLSTGEEVTAGVPSSFHPLPGRARASEGQPNRLALAQWLVDDENPLTARVIANRHWEEIFGVGIVQTSEEFGSQGELPSHPKLLDWLAVELVESGWDLKHLLKLLVTSATYRQSSYCSESNQAADPFNRLYARGPRFRASAEVVRDQALFVSGLLSSKMHGPPVNPPQPELGLKAAFGSATDWKTSSGGDRYRRGIYTTWRRSSPYPSMAQFDAPNREVCTVRRIRTNTPLQALVTLNDPVYVEAAQALARRMILADADAAERIREGVRHGLIREPSEAEIARLVDLAASSFKRYSADPDEAKQLATDPIGPLPGDMEAAEAAAWTVVGNVILNLDEMFMKR